MTASNEHAFAMLDAFPVSNGHCLVIPRRHIVDLTQLPEEEYLGCFELLREVASSYRQNGIESFNIGVNVREAAGQTVEHAHIHLIPRRLGDVTDPRGGVRGVIPEKQRY